MRLTGSLQQGAKRCLLLLTEALHKLVFVAENDLVQSVLAVYALGQDIDPLAPPVCRVPAQLHKALLLQPGQKAGHRGMAQVEGLFQIPGAGGLGVGGKIAHDLPLSGGKLHSLQSSGHILIGAPVENPHQMPDICVQRKSPP